MPVLTFPLALLLCTCFVVGSLVTWMLQERRHRREQDSLEQQMARALQARYEVYEGLEQSVVKLLTRFEAMEHEFRRRLTEAQHPELALDKTMRLRSSHPEVWEIEREYHRERSEHLAEIARQSGRIAELMDSSQSVERVRNELESTLQQVKHDLEAQLAHTRTRYETAVANATDADKVSEAKLGRLQARVAQLEPLESLCEAGRREIESLRAKEHALASEARAQALGFEKRVAELTLACERVPSLEEALSRREAEGRNLKARVAELENELDSTRKSAESSEARCASLTQERESARKALSGLESKLELTRTSQVGLQREYDNARAQLTELDERTKNQAATIADALLASDSLRDQLASANASFASSTSRVAELERLLEGARAEGKSKFEKVQDELIDAYPRQPTVISDMPN